ncbi:hypothetical protein QJS10_CPA01g01735 [Acorus calamus]|uniref:Uncharacterized protein n=1 Tax=Acorus calamus TaxID=4465 RepID=A0AAV9FK07_ACOCL|nr:hypothetical protein QJS10_CPA01g01735 [Acorus calamus]
MDRRSVHSICWEVVTANKDYGGLGIQRLPHLCKAVLATLAFRLLLHPTPLCKSITLKYGWTGNPWELPKLRNSFAVWRALCQGLQMERPYVRKVPGQLEDIDVIRDPWLSSVPFSRIPTYLNMDQIQGLCGAGSIPWQRDRGQGKYIAPYQLWQNTSWIGVFSDQERGNDPKMTCRQECLNNMGSDNLRSLTTDIIRDENIKYGGKYFDSWRLRKEKPMVLITDGSVDPLTRRAGAGFVIVCFDPIRIIGAGYKGWLWASPLRTEAEAIRLGTRQAVSALEQLAKLAQRAHASQVRMA